VGRKNTETLCLKLLDENNYLLYLETVDEKKKKQAY